MGEWNGGINSTVSVMVDSGMSGYCFYDTITPALRYTTLRYQELTVSQKITSLELISGSGALGLAMQAAPTAT